ncbi:MAG: hypothetical protein QOH63_1801 [Acidobacteriota bacterium]|jgi:hypothetical protein|nr:hypothetical protein [Acidobacteriota bacterium]
MTLNNFNPHTTNKVRITNIQRRLSKTFSVINKQPRWLFFAGIAILTFGLRVGTYLSLSNRWDFRQALTWDGWGRIALFMSHGYGLADNYRLTYFLLGDIPVPTAARMPLPIFLFAGTLRLFGNGLLQIVILQAVIDAGTAVITYLITCRLFRTVEFIHGNSGQHLSHLAGLLAALGFAFFLPEWSYFIGFQSEPLLTFLLTAALALAMFARIPIHLVATGAFFGLAALVNPSVLPFTILLVPWLIWGRGLTFRRALLVPVLALLIVLPWGLRNYVVFHQAVITNTLGGYNFYRHSGVIEEDNYLRYVKYDEANEKILNLLNSRGLTPNTTSETALDALLMQEARQIIMAHPWRYVNLCLHRAVWLFYYEDLDDYIVNHPKLYYAFKLALYGMLCLAVWRYRGKWIKRVTPLWLMFGYIILVHSIIVAQFRYLLPLIPLLLSICAYAVVQGSLEISRLVLKIKKT